MTTETASGAKRPTLAALGLALAVLAIGSGYALAVPAGEAPDEPAHLAYVGFLLLHHALPPLPHPPYGDRYESYQAPLDYVAAALAASALGIHSLALSFQPNPAFSFFEQGSRAYVPAVAGGSIERRIRELREVHLLWAAVTAVLVLFTCLRLAVGRLDLALAAAAPFVLSPQYLFVGATVNNDGAVTACAALATFGFVQLLDAERPSPWAALLAGIAVGLAPFGKVSGFLLLAPLGIAAAFLLRRRAYRTAVLLLVPAGALAASWMGLSLWRFGTVFPPPPTGLREGLGVSRELLNPHWLGSLWLSFWGKLGWLNLRLPLFAYLFFAVPTALAAVGALRRAAASPEERMRESWRYWLLLSTIGANLLLVVAYLVRIDWQPQGRYFFPSLPALAGLAALGLRRIAEDPRWRHQLVRGLLALLIVSALGMALLGLLVIGHAYS
jgi:4-amino-4-deoxy-L-arabinose transferase-like glycosyltransferase